MVYFVPTPIGNLADISHRALEILSRCEIVFSEDTRVSKKLFNLLSQKYSLDFTPKKFHSLHSHNEKEILSNIDISIFKKDCVYVTDAGMPCISDPGVFLVRFLQENGIEYEVLSGANALLLGASASGLIFKEFIFLGFLPNRGKDRDIAISNLMNNPYPTVIYESPLRVLNLVENIANLDSQREIFIIKEATKKFEFKARDSAINISNLLKSINLNGEWCLVIDSNKNQNQERITIKDIMELELPAKQKAKLISKISGKPVKDCYSNLIK